MAVSSVPLKLVAHKADGTLIKGFAVDLPNFSRETLGSKSLTPPPQVLEVKLKENGNVTKVALKDLKALFVVKSFDGSNEYNEIKFFRSHPLQEGLWVRLQFRDGESTEGVVFNSLEYIVNYGFFLKPPDPHSNNEIVYVLKDSLSDFRVLGVRNNY
jgi:hypothetical protein